MIHMTIFEDGMSTGLTKTYVSRVRGKTMHSLSCMTSWLPYITLCYIDSRFFLPLQQRRRIAIAASRLREAVRWQLHWPMLGFVSFVN